MKNTKKSLLITLIIFLSGNVQAAFEVKEIPEKHIDVKYEGKVIARVMTAYDDSTKETRHETYKVYTHVYDRDGLKPITKGAGGQFTHHRGIFIGWSKTKFSGKSVDSWHMKGCDQVYKKIIKSNVDDNSASLTILIEWVTSDGVVFISEERTQVFQIVEGSEAFLEVDFNTELKALAADIELNGDPEHAGCQFRPSNEVSKNKSAKYLFHKEEVDPKKDRDLPWVAESFKIADQMYFAQHMSHPTIPKGNIYSAYRDYGRFGAYFVSKISKNESLKLNYKFVIGNGEMPGRNYFHSRYKAFTNQ